MEGAGRWPLGGFFPIMWVLGRQGSSRTLGVLGTRFIRSVPSWTLTTSSSALFSVWMELLFSLAWGGEWKERPGSGGRKEKDRRKIGEKETISQLITQFQI